MRRGLGRGLSHLIAEQQVDSGVQELAITSIHPNKGQPRTHFDESALSELAESIRQLGIIQPILVRAVAEGKYELIAGERRWRASQIAGLKMIPAIVRSAGAETTLELALVENIQREDISAIECARAFYELQQAYGLTQEQIATKVGKSRVTVTNTMRLLRLPQNIQDAMLAGSLSEGHARALLSLDTPSQQQKMADRILEEGLSVRDVENLVRKGPSADKKPRAPKSGSGKPSPQVDPDTIALQSALSVYLGSPTHIEPSHIGGKIVIDYYSDEDLQRVLDILGVTL